MDLRGTARRRHMSRACLPSSRSAPASCRPAARCAPRRRIADELSRARARARGRRGSRSPTSCCASCATTSTSATCRSSWPSTPSARARRMPALDADEIIVHPLRIEELGVRIARARSRHGIVTRDDIRLGSLEIDLAAYEVLVDGEPLELTHMEYCLLELLVTHPQPRLLARAAAEPDLGPASRRERARGRRPCRAAAREARSASMAGASAPCATSATASSPSGSRQPRRRARYPRR